MGLIKLDRKAVHTLEEFRRGFEDEEGATLIPEDRHIIPGTDTVGDLWAEELLKLAHGHDILNLESALNTGHAPNGDEVEHRIHLTSSGGIIEYSRQGIDILVDHIGLSIIAPGFSFPGWYQHGDGDLELDQEELDSALQGSTGPTLRRLLAILFEQLPRLQEQINIKLD